MSAKLTPDDVRAIVREEMLALADQLWPKAQEHIRAEIRVAVKAEVAPLVEHVIGLRQRLQLAEQGIARAEPLEAVPPKRKPAKAKHGDVVTRLVRDEAAEQVNPRPAAPPPKPADIATTSIKGEAADEIGVPVPPGLVRLRRRKAARPGRRMGPVVTESRGRRRLAALLERMTQETAAEQAGVSRRALSHWARGRYTPEYDGRKALFAAFEIPIDAWDEA